VQRNDLVKASVYTRLLGTWAHNLRRYESLEYGERTVYIGQITQCLTQY
jgi:hypothetical protein